MNKKYYSLLVRENRNTPWSIHFGDYVRETVRQERFDITQYEYKFSDTKLITTDGTQSEIDNAVKYLNSF